jgi:hydroxymethylbilane synthase
MLPAVGQGALAIELRQGDARTSSLLAAAGHAETKIATLAERGLMSVVEGDCQTPVAAYALRQEAELWLRGMLAEPDGSRYRARELRAPWPSDEAAADAAGRELGRMLLAAS